MIRKFMLISGASGLLLYKTSFEIESSDRIQQPDGRTGLIAGLITALIDFSQKQVQVPFTHMKFEKLALHVVDTMVFVSRSQQQRVICCLESDSEDDERFGRLVASELLFAFVDEYAEKLADMSARAENYEALFEDFSSRIYFIMENLATPIMRDLEEKEGVKYAILLKPSMSEYDYNILSSVWYPSRHPNHTVVLAEVQSFLNVAADIMSDSSSSMVSAKLGKNILIRRLEKATLVVVCRSAASYKARLPDVERCISSLRHVFGLLDFLKGT